MRTYRLAVFALIALTAPAAALLAQRATDRTDSRGSSPAPRKASKPLEGPTGAASSLAADPTLAESYATDTTAEVSGARPISQPVTVTNFPAVQEVAGTVSIRDCPLNDSRVQLAGFTQEPFTGAVGIMQLNAACDTEFPGSRWCTSEEIISQTRPLPLQIPVAVGTAWVRPTFVPVSWATSSPRFYDITGLGGAVDDAMCNARRSDSSQYRGLAISHSGDFSQVQCDRELSLACCM